MPDHVTLQVPLDEARAIATWRPLRGDTESVPVLLAAAKAAVAKLDAPPNSWAVREVADTGTPEAWVVVHTLIDFLALPWEVES